MRSRAGDVQLELREVDVGLTQTFVFHLRSTAPHAIRQVWLTEASNLPCMFGDPATWVTVDRRPTPKINPGDHELRATFPPTTDPMSTELVVDVKTDDGCLRAPALSRSLPIEPPRRFVLEASNGIDGNSALGGLRALYTGRLGGGGWLGPVLLTADAGLGVAICELSVCGKGSDGNLRSQGALSAAVDGRYAFFSFVRNQTSSILSAGARYSYQRIRLPGLDRERRFDAHGFYGVFGWGFGQAHAEEPYRHLERTPQAELVIPLGVMIERGGPGNRVAFSGGFGLRLLLPL